MFAIQFPMLPPWSAVPHPKPPTPGNQPSTKPVECFVTCRHLVNDDVYLPGQVLARWYAHAIRSDPLLIAAGIFLLSTDGHRTTIVPTVLQGTYELQCDQCLAWRTILHSLTDFEIRLPGYFAAHSDTLAALLFKLSDGAISQTVTKASISCCSSVRATEMRWCPSRTK